MLFCLSLFERVLLQRREAEAKRLRQLEEDEKRKTKESEDQRRRDQAKRKQRNHPEVLRLRLQEVQTRRAELEKVRDDVIKSLKTIHDRITIRRKEGLSLSLSLGHRFD